MRSSVVALTGLRVVELLVRWHRRSILPDSITCSLARNPFRQPYQALLVYFFFARLPFSSPIGSVFVFLLGLRNMPRSAMEPRMIAYFGVSL